MYVRHKIKELRKQKKIGQREMAQKLNVSISSYQKIEQNIMVLSINRFMEICRILEVQSYNDLLPAVSADIVEKVDMVLNENRNALDDIYQHSKYCVKTIDGLIEKIESSKFENKDIIEELEFINNYMSIIKRQSSKQRHQIVTIQDLKERID